MICISNIKDLCLLRELITWLALISILQNLYRTIIEPLQNLYRTITEPLQNHYRTITEPLQNIYRTFTEPLQNHYRTNTEPLQNHYKNAYFTWFNILLHTCITKDNTVLLLLFICIIFLFFYKYKLVKVQSLDSAYLNLALRTCLNYY